MDILTGTLGNDLLVGDLGDNSITGDSGDDTLKGNQGNDLIKGNQGNDLLNGGKDDDTIFGDDGNDNLFGDDGNDTIDGGAFSDVLSGDGGIDTFILSSDSSDIITDFRIDDNSDEGDRLVLPQGVTIDDVVIVEGSKTTDTTLGIVSSNGDFETQTLAVFSASGSNGFVQNKTITQAYLDATMTFEEFQAEG